MYKQQFKYLEVPMPDRHKVSAFQISCVALRFGLCFEHLNVRDFV
jgi:hypothetical protein